MLTPDETLEFASEHDMVVMRCLADLLANDHGLGSATAGGWAAYWRSWADTLPALHGRRLQVVADVGHRDVVQA